MVLVLLMTAGLLPSLLPAAPPAAALAQPPPAAASFERVELIALTDPAAVARYVEAHGGTVELRSHDRVQALLPHDGLAEALDAPKLFRVAPPAFWTPLQIADAEALLGVDRWRSAGFTGKGVSVAIIDAGFEGFRAALGETLPATVRDRSFRGDGAIEAGTRHGTLAAQVVHAIAPDAELYLLNFSTVTELSAAVDFAVAEGIEVVSFSLGFIHNGAGDGTGAVNAIVSRSTEAGAVWAVAAGNWARQHWSGDFFDPDDDSVHDFMPGVRQNGRYFEQGDLIIASLRWDDEWGTACSDYDLELFGPHGALVRTSRGLQDCAGDPVEGFQVLATTTGRYSARIVRATDDEARRLDLMLIGRPDRGEPLDFFVAASSLSEPADHRDVITTGALGGLLRAAGFSSRGPTVDGRAKPDVLSPTGMAPPGVSVFAGTSAAAPHVAGVVVLVRQALPGAGAERVRLQIAARAVPLDGPTAEGAPELLANLGSLIGLGATLPADAAAARLVGGFPPGEGLALVVYRGPDGYALRFIHLLTEGRSPAAIFRLNVAEQRWERHIFGAPSRINQFGALLSDEVYVIRFAGE